MATRPGPDAMMARAADDDVATSADDARSDTIWLFCLLQGLVLTVMGALALFYPLTTLVAGTMILAAMAFIDGLVALWEAIRHHRGKRRWLNVARGLLSLLLGIVFLALPLLTTFSLSMLVLVALGLWAMLTGAARIAKAVRCRHKIEGEWAIGLWGLLLLLLGLFIPLLLALRPEAFVGLAWVIGIYALFTGITLVSRGLSLRHLVRSAPR